MFPVPMDNRSYCNSPQGVKLTRSSSLSLPNFKQCLMHVAASMLSPNDGAGCFQFVILERARKIFTEINKIKSFEQTWLVEH